MGNIFGYIRVSSRDQNEDRQLIALKELAIPEKNIFIDKQSGKDFKNHNINSFIFCENSPLFQYFRIVTS